MADPAHVATSSILTRVENEIAREYAQAQREVTEKFEDYMRRYKIKDEKWRQWVKDGTKTKEEYQHWLTGQVMIGKRWEELKDTLATDYTHAAEIADSIVNGYMPQVYALNHNYATFQVENGSLIDTSYTLYSRESVERMWRDNPKLYKKPGADIQRQIREGKLKAWNRKQIQSVMTQGILQGESIPNLTKRLERVTGGEHAAAIRNARTMTTGVQNAGRVDAYRRANDLGIETKKQWLATLDDRTRHWHRELDGVAVDVDEPFEVFIPTKDGGFTDKIMYPGDPDADGANVYNCRCTLIAAIRGHEIDAEDMSLRDDSRLGDMSYDEWLEEHGQSQPITRQEEIGNAYKWSYIREYRDG